MDRELLAPLRVESVGKPVVPAVVAVAPEFAPPVLLVAALDVLGIAAAEAAAVQIAAAETAVVPSNFLSVDAESLSARQFHAELLEFHVAPGHGVDSG